METRLYAGTTAGVRRSDNPSGLSPGWGLAGSGVERYRVLSMAYSSAGTTLYAGTEGNGVAKCTSPATSPSWSGTGTTISGYTVYSVAYDSSRNLIYAGTNGHGVWRCSNPDTNPSWTSLGGSVSGYNFRALAYDSSRNKLYGSTDYGHGLYRCDNPDSTSLSWESLGGVEGPQGGYVDQYSLAYDGEMNILYVGTATNGVHRVDNPHGSSYSWGRVGGTFIGIPILEDMTGYTAYSLVLDGHGSSKYLYAGTGGEGVWRNTHPEFGLFNPTWERMTTMLFQTYHSLHYDTNNNVLYAGGVGAIRCDNPRAADPRLRTGPAS